MISSNIQGHPCADLWSNLSMHLIPFWRSIQIRATLASLNSGLCLQLFKTAVLCWDSSSLSVSRKCLHEESWGNPWVQLICFPSFRGHSPGLPIVWCPEIVFLPILSSFIAGRLVWYQLLHHMVRVETVLFFLSIIS